MTVDVKSLYRDNVRPKTNIEHEQMPVSGLQRCLREKLGISERLLADRDVCVACEEQPGRPVSRAGGALGTFPRAGGRYYQFSRARL